jgi:nitroimidazol reductase NimA-like FMN-containing flavoprotein (pyridoxamine 5'-phosphate oxidase superfamily)
VQEKLLTRTQRTRLRRSPNRASYDREFAYAILDEAIVCHLGFVHDSQPYVIPTLCARVGDVLYLHGSAAGRALKQMKSLPRVCVNATITDGLVLARSAFFHSVNYRSVVVLGAAEEITGDEKLVALEAFTNTVVPGRWDHVRGPSRQELKATTILRMPLEEASIKHRNGPPGDAPEDLELDHWSGVIPLELRALTPVPNPNLRPDIAIPTHVVDFKVRAAPHPIFEV